jgi:general secretion pathway protein K
MSRLFQKERGSATITALIVVSISTLIISGLMWRQEVQVRQLEHRRLQQQAVWIERSAIDLARVVLREDLRNSGVADFIGEPWSLPLAQSRVADFFKSTDLPYEIENMTIRGQLIDAQSRFNLRNLLTNDGQQFNAVGILIYSRLLNVLGLDGQLANPTALFLLKNGLAFNHPEQLRGITGYSDKSIQLLSQYVITLPKATPINLNTASIEVLMAISPSISRDDAEKITLARVIQPFKSTGDFLKLLQSAVSSGSQMVLDNSQIDVKSQFWLAQSDIELGRSHFLNVTLIQRTDNLPEKGNSTQVIWTQLSNSIRP